MIRSTRRPLILAAVGVALAACAAPALGYQVTNGGWSGSGTLQTLTALTRTTTLPSGLTVGITASGAPGTTIWSTSETLTTRGGTNAMFLGGTITSANGLTLATTCSTIPVSVAASGCTEGALVVNRGTYTITFSQPVTDPVLNVAGLGGTNTTSRALWSELQIMNAGMTFTLLGSNGNLDLTNGNTYLNVTNNNAGANCATTSNGHGVAGCGSVRINGTGTSFTLQSNYESQNINTPGTFTGPEDAFNFTLAAYDDFGSAPSSYDTSATSNIVGDLFMGSGITPDALTTMNASSDPNGDVEASSAFKALPTGATAPGAVGSTYSVSVPVTGSGAGSVCGWVDWNGNGGFDSSERQCSAFAAGTSTATLSWTIPAGSTASPTWMRLRASYDTSGVQSPTGKLSSGETEDYAVPAPASGPATPSASPDTTSGPQGQAQSIDLLANDTASAGATLTPSTVRLCGALEVSPSCMQTTVVVIGVGTYAVSGGTITFTPEPAYTGTPAALPYIVVDSSSQTAASTYTPTVTPASPGGGSATTTPTADGATTPASTRTASKPRLAIRTTASVPVLHGGQRTTITLVVRNAGGAAAAGTVTRASIPAGFAVARRNGGSLAAGVIRFRTGDIAPGGRVTRTYVLVATRAAVGTGVPVMGRATATNTAAVKDATALRVIGAAAGTAAVTG